MGDLLTHTEDKNAGRRLKNRQTVTIRNGAKAEMVKRNCEKLNKRAVLKLMTIDCRSYVTDWKAPRNT